MKNKILVLGATGKVGGETLRILSNRKNIEPIAAIRSENKAKTFEERGIATRTLDLDKPETLSTALEGIDRALLLTGYTVDMLKQSKRFLDTAKAKGVQHVVHIGASGAPTNEVAHWGWHQFVETYTESLGFTWTHLRPEAYMQNITGPGYRWLENDTITHFIENATWSWVDCLDVAAVAAEALLKPETHHGKIIPLGYDAKTMDQVAEVLSEASNKQIVARSEAPESFLKAAIESGADAAYMHCVYTQFKLNAANEIPEADKTHDNFEAIVGRPPITWETFAQREKETI